MDRWIVESPCRYIIYGLDQMPYNNLRWLHLLYCLSYQSQARIFTQSLGRKRRKYRNIVVLGCLLLKDSNSHVDIGKSVKHTSPDTDPWFWVSHCWSSCHKHNSMVMSITLLKPFSIPPFGLAPQLWCLCLISIRILDIPIFLSSSLLMADNQQLTCGHFSVAFCFTDFVLEESNNKIFIRPTI